jgi:phospholipase C
MANLSVIEHVVVLMMENRSFDCLLGKLYPVSSNFDGLTGTESNQVNGKTYPVWNGADLSSTTLKIPDPDPGEYFADITMQLFGTTAPVAGQTADMSGFAQNYVDQPHVALGADDPCPVMHYFTPDQVPVISQLARQFAVSDRWFAFAPCQTWPNRFFLHTATANGYEDNNKTHLPFKAPTIFGRFDKANISNGWKIYFHDVPQTLTLSELWPAASKFRMFEEFQDDAKRGTLPHYSFIEPRYFTDWKLPNDQHPAHVVSLGEQLIADVYKALRNGPNWKQTLLIITYDEHGGCYDHVPPPDATAPFAIPTVPFNFNRYGVRVPAVFVSPWIAQGTILRPPGKIPFDHTSVIATLRKRFGLGGPLTLRDANSPDIESVLSLTTPDNDGPAQIDAHSYVAGPAEIAQARLGHTNNMQKALLQMAATLPGADIPQAMKSVIEQRIETLPPPVHGLEGGMLEKTSPPVLPSFSRG